MDGNRGEFFCPSQPRLGVTCSGQWGVGRCQLELNGSCFHVLLCLCHGNLLRLVWEGSSQFPTESCHHSTSLPSPAGVCRLLCIVWLQTTDCECIFIVQRYSNGTVKSRVSSVACLLRRFCEQNNHWKSLDFLAVFQVRSWVMWKVEM